VEQPLPLHAWRLAIIRWCVSLRSLSTAAVALRTFSPQVHTDRPLAIRVRMQSTELFHFSQTFETQITLWISFFGAGGFAGCAAHGHALSINASPAAMTTCRWTVAVSHPHGEGCSACGFGGAACAAPRSARTPWRTHGHTVGSWVHLAVWRCALSRTVGIIACATTRRCALSHLTFARTPRQWWRAQHNHNILHRSVYRLQSH
jgi:hypothetical protein